MPNGLGKRGLRDSQPLLGTAVIEHLGQLQKIFQLFRVHANSLLDMLIANGYGSMRSIILKDGKIKYIMKLSSRKGE